MFRGLPIYVKQIKLNVLFKVFEGFLKTFVPIYFRFPTQNVFGFGDVRLPLFGVVLRKGFENDFGFGTG